MSERDEKKTSGERGRSLRCDQWEDMITDALDGTLSPADEAAFARHHGECPLCVQLYKQAQQGKAWMEYIAVEPVVPADLLGRILARSGPHPAGAPQTATGVAPAPAVKSGFRFSLPFQRQTMRQLGRQVLEPRFMMTVAMAFFSIALTLNLTGINLSQVRAADLQPSRLRATLTRQYYTANEQVTKYYENLRLVYEMEARVRELRRTTETPAPQPAAPATPAPRQPSRDGTGSPSSSGPKDSTPGTQGRRNHLNHDVFELPQMAQAIPPHVAGTEAERSLV